MPRPVAVTVTSAAGGTPTGTATVFYGGAGATTPPGTPVCTVALSSGTGSCALPSATLPAGTPAVTAVYSGDTNYVPSASAAAPFTVTRNSTATLLTLTTHTLAYGNEKAGQVTVSVVPHGGGLAIAAGCGMTKLLPLLGQPDTPAPTALTLNREDDSWIIGYARTRIPDSPDQQARATYWQRLTDLGQELAEAEEWNDTERAGRLRAEKDFLVSELTAATGLGGRARRLGSESERARINVTRAVRSAISRIRDRAPGTAAHFGQNVRTGARCRYSPPGSPA